MNARTETLTPELLSAAMEDQAAAFRAIARLEPAGGPVDKVFPPTYAGGAYATERRRVGDEEVETVLLDSVQSQANRMELALRAAHERGEIRLPLVVTDFSEHLPHIGRITALDAPHRIADAIFRESLLDGTPFRDAKEGRAFVDARASNATALFELCPTALVFGVWDSTGPRGGLGAKFQRALVSEIVGFHALTGVRTASRVDPLPIAAQVTIYETDDGGWTTEEGEARRDKDKPVVRRTGRPSEINLGNVTPDLVRDDRGNLRPGGVSISHALQTSVVSLPALRRLRFPVDGQLDPELDSAARRVLAALGIAAIAYQQAEGYDLRSRCLLVASEPLRFELVRSDGAEPSQIGLDVAAARDVFNDAVKRARSAGLPWREEEIVLAPSPRLLELIRRSEQIAAQLPPEEVV